MEYKQPASLGNLTQIIALHLSRNHFSGKISKVIKFFNNLRNLISLGLSSNNFSGQLPPSIGNLTNLQDLYFSDNFNVFNGTIPSWLYSMPSLVQLDLNHNKLTGHIGEFQFDSLEYIDLSMNELHGSIPGSIFKLINLRYLFLSSNNFSGVLETSNFGKLRNLTSLDLSNNMLSLTTSDDSKSMLPYIESLDLSNMGYIWNLLIWKEIECTMLAPLLVIYVKYLNQFNTCYRYLGKKNINKLYDLTFFNQVDFNK